MPGLLSVTRSGVSGLNADTAALILFAMSLWERERGSKGRRVGVGRVISMVIITTIIMIIIILPTSMILPPSSIYAFPWASPSNGLPLTPNFSLSLISKFNNTEVANTTHSH